MAFPDRVEAGRVLARKLRAYSHRSDVVVLGLPRGGVPVAEQVALALGAPLDVFVVRKLGAPDQEELAMGALASGGVQVIDEATVRSLGVSHSELDEIIRNETRELQRREEAFRRGAPPLDVSGQTAILVDDGLATGASMRAAVEALRRRGAGRVVVAVPVGAHESCAELGRYADDVICAITPAPFFGVGLWYQDFSQTTDEEVRACLDRARLTTAARQASEARPKFLGQPGRPTDPVVLVRESALPLQGSGSAENLILNRASRTRFVLIGEATHGTHEFYRYRAELTKRLIAELGFQAVAVEADWPDAYRINRYVRGEPGDSNAEEALGGFGRFPSWMWRNADVLDFVGWLRAYNDSIPQARDRVGLYGLDLYSLHASASAVIAYLDRVDPEAAKRARDRYGCFDHALDDGQSYGFAAGLGLSETCEQEVLAQLLELRRRGWDGDGGSVGDEERFNAEQNAFVAKNAEAYYRTMFRGRVSSWNLRDRHMMDTLEALWGHLGRGRADLPRIVVWAHNSHLGDARATDMESSGELNLGQLVRERHASDALLIGLTTHSGTVTAASAWGGHAERKSIRPALASSYEGLFHETGIEEFLLPLWQSGPAVEALHAPRLERAIGVVYLPERERLSHYFHADLPRQFDAVIHFDRTREVEPLERESAKAQEEVPETYPSAV
jgi:erythromycin esterase-like protein/predicted phosphoribosyltransferase